MSDSSFASPYATNFQKAVSCLPSLVMEKLKTEWSLLVPSFFPLQIMFQPSNDETTGTSIEQSGTGDATSGNQGGDDGQQTTDANQGQQSSSSQSDDGQQPKDGEAQSSVSKESRHFSRKINQEIDKRVHLALDIIQDNPDYIYRLAERDPDVADRIIREDSSSFGNARDSKDLLKRKKLEDGDGVRETTIEHDERLERVERQQRETRIKDLKRNHPDLEGELEDEFLRMDSNTYFDRYSDDAKVDMARAALGKEAPERSADSVALEMLGQRDASTVPRRSSPAGRSSAQGQETTEEIRTRQAFKNEPGDEEKYLTQEEREYIATQFS